MNAARTTRNNSPQSVAPPGATEVTEVSFPIVGIGASAGGLSAFEAFFSGMPADIDPGMAFVLVQHLAPDHKSILAELIRRYTRMQVFEVEDGMLVRVNCAYIIPPNHDMAFLNGTLQLLEPSEPRGRRLPIDFFFRSLAQDQHQLAIGIVLSGTGSDGTLGVRAIKGEAGMVMVQSPESTEFDGMPRSAIATGLVDWELPPAAMPAQLIAYVAHAFGEHSALIAEQTPSNENALKKIFILLRAQTGHDLSQYKTNTINRRIVRRMALHQIESIEDYVRYLQKSRAEVDALFRDLLIGVTSFFRDPQAFQALEEQVIPQIFDNTPPGSVIRVWSTGCSTGEEAYSIAILLQERMEALKQGWTLQVFASDIDRHAIAAARAAVYPASVAADISPQRLARFFTAEADGSAYRINKSIRDLLVFSEHDLLRDPPFSRLDLISCRNLLIYLGAELQKSIIPLFHYALNPSGMLFLGTSESVGGYFNLFSVLDRKAKIYQRQEDFAGKQYAALRRFLPTRTVLSRSSAKGDSPVRLPLREVAEQSLLEQIGVAGALINGQGDIFYLHGRTGAYLEPAPGEAGINNILRMAREGLRLELGMALAKAASSQHVVRVSGLHVKTNGHFSWVRLSVGPVTRGTGVTPESPLYLVTLEESPILDPAAAALPAAGAADTEVDADARMAALTEELRAKDEYLQSTREELETANEELKSSNEEMQSVNEELQSTNEELETSKEELQSVNEELATVNAELNTKVLDLSRANNDMNNLLAGTGIATVFVDHCLRILRFTPSASQIINLIPGDVGRAVGHIVSNLVGYDRLVADVQGVLDTLAPKEAQVRSTAGRWYTMSIRPYRTLDNVIEGAVITFVDITEMRRIEDALAKEQPSLRLAVVVRDAFDAITVHDLDGRIIAWNPAAERIYGWSEAEALLLNVRDRIPPLLRDDALVTLREFDRDRIPEPYHTQRLTRSGAVLEVSVTATALLDASGQIYAMATTERVRDAPAHASGEA
ncbi:MAG: PAS domain-containing protein [Candidatus Accumulibacter sp.]|uniref:CheR family methyltransferase n=1 Tax=Accumulibacter sp. TaxID=2053492 RepID=UPI001ACBDA5F|nr:CheR family methyltransferase [Accumulibacter sp.]MBN8437168.1 PAS domain-containing protein [Accumulibacter sp.]